MSYVTSPKQLKDIQELTEVTSRLQSITDDVYSLNSVAMPFRTVTYELNTVSGRPLRITPGFKPYGAFILHTGGAIVETVKTELRGTDAVEITTTFSGLSSSAKILYMVIGAIQNVRK